MVHEGDCREGDVESVVETIQCWSIKIRIMLPATTTIHIG